MLQMVVFFLKRKKIKEYLLDSHAQEYSDSKNQNSCRRVYNSTKPWNGVTGQVRRQLILTSKK